MHTQDVRQDSLWSDGECALEIDLWYANSIFKDAAGEAGDASADQESVCAHTDLARLPLAAHSQLRSLEETRRSPLAASLQPTEERTRRGPDQPASSHKKRARTAATAVAAPMGTTLLLLEQNLRKNEFKKFRSQQDIKPSHLVPSGDVPAVPSDDLRSKCRLPVAGIRRHMKEEEGVALVASETPVVLAHLSEMLIKDLCEAAAACSSTDDISSDDFARAIRQHDRFGLLME